MKTILAAFLSGLAGSLGLGGGGVLVLYLVLALGMPQLKAQGMTYAILTLKDTAGQVYYLSLIHI